MATVYHISAGLPPNDLSVDSDKNTFLITAGIPSQELLAVPGAINRFLSDGTFVREDKDTTVFVRQGFLAQQTGAGPGPVDPLLPPTNLAAYGISTTQIEASWHSVASATGYEIRYRIKST